MFPVAVLLLLAAGSYVKCEQLTQPASVTLQPGQRLSISCQVSYALSSHHTHWIRQPAGQGLEWIGAERVGQTSYYKESLKNKFSMELDTSSKTVTLKGQNMQPGETAVYYCARGTGVVSVDYWGKGTLVTVTSATSTGPSVFPLMPCGDNNGNMITLGCLATGFTPSLVTITWNKNGAALPNSVQYPPVLKDNLYSEVSQIQIPRQDWDARQPFQCAVSHAAGNAQTTITKPMVRYLRPELKVLAFTGESEISFLCSAKDFSPKDYQIKWLKKGVEIQKPISEIQTPPEEKKDENGSLFSSTSVLTVLSSEVDAGSEIMCEFKGKNEKGDDFKNATLIYKPEPETDQTMDCGNVEVHIQGPTIEDMFLEKKGTLECQVTMKEPGIEKIYWEDQKGTEIAAAAIKPDGKQTKFFLPLDITYDEWSQGIRLNCVVVHRANINHIRKAYERNAGGQIQRPSVYMMPPVEQVKKDMVTLTCYVKDFSPQEIFVSWLVDDQKTEFNFNTTKPIENNGLFSAYGQLTLSHEEWKKEDVVYSCIVYHQSLVSDKRAIVRSTGYKTFDKTYLISLNMNIPEKCKA